MYIRIADELDLNSIVKIINNSKLGLRYFENDTNKLERVIKTALEKKEIHIRVDDNNKCLGVLQVNHDGAFDKYPYIHFLVVHECERGKGIGTELLRYMEDVLHEKTRKIFLLVGTWNVEAQRLYARLGYRAFCAFDNFYKLGETEVLMVKERMV